MKEVKRIILGIIFLMLLVGCTPDPIEDIQEQEKKSQIQFNIPPKVTGTFCTYTTYSHYVDIPPTGNLADVSFTIRWMYYNIITTKSTNIKPDGTIIDQTKVQSSEIKKMYPGLSSDKVDTWICN